ncbi:hypothetical protein [Hydrocarboniphaga effusa]|uniref:hypothetical protein n=1 Tax=Hydrocarboniphaga effusa TaxID=243629 RepID=UPI00398C0B85
MTDLLIHGMHGLGDNLHQRSVLRQLIPHHRIWLETPWPCVYHDLVGDRLKLISKGSRLRTQAKNATREAARFSRLPPPLSARRRPLSVSYAPDLVRSHGSVLGAMSAHCGVQMGDFSLPIPGEWQAKASRWLAQWSPSKPLMIYRPLVERSEWGGCPSRNPDHAAYAKLAESIRDRYFVISIADLQPGAEWIVGKPLNADVEMHAGELDFETIAALTARAALVFSSPGFAVILAQSVGAPVCCVFGGYENASSFSGGAHLAPYLGIQPINPCDCFSHRHPCDKRIDMLSAMIDLQNFVNETADLRPLAA